MYFRFLCLNRRVSFRLGLLLLALGLVHLTLSSLWLPYVHLTGHVRPILVEFLSGLAIGLGLVLMVSSFGALDSSSGECLSIQKQDEDRTHSSEANL